MSKPIYFDYAATTPVDPRVVDVMSGCLAIDGVFANPASRSHIYGWQAEEQVELARSHVAELLVCDPREVVWTSGATEADNLALKGIFEKKNFKGHLITSAIEHKAILDTAVWLESRGVEVTYLTPDSEGLISLEQVKQSVTAGTHLVSLMYVNNETGVINPIEEIGRFCRENEITFHVDAAQAVGRLNMNVDSLQVDLMSLSAHKFYGPKGVGALYARRPVQRTIAPQMHGGGHERGLRSGTLPTHQLVGMGEAAKIVSSEFAEEAKRLDLLRDKLWAGIKDLSGIERNGSDSKVSPSHLNISFGNVDGESLLLSLREIAVSTGSACTSASMAPSYVLKAMGVSDEKALSSIRISLGRFTTEEEIDRAIIHIRQTVTQLQAA
ncbi:MAG: aminotransferase class V-fold PLP-dependent enzyme [Cellvibrionaceae bacterium]